MPLEPTNLAGQSMLFACQIEDNFPGLVCLSHWPRVRALALDRPGLVVTLNCEPTRLLSARLSIRRRHRLLGPAKSE